MTDNDLIETIDADVPDTIREASTPALLRAAYALTHRIHAAQQVVYVPDVRDARIAEADLRAQRDLIDAEVLRRTGDAPAADVQVWGPREDATGPVHRALDGRGLYGQSWCGKRAQFRHRVYDAPADTVTCKTCLRRVASGSPLAYGARS